MTSQIKLRIKKRQEAFLLLFTILLSFSFNFLYASQTAGFSPINSSLSTQTYQTHSFQSLGIVINSLNWSGKGFYTISSNKSFDLPSNGPVLLIIEYSYLGKLPDNPGYTINGIFNQKEFHSTIKLSVLFSLEPNEKSQIVIPLKSEGRIFSNFIELNVSTNIKYDTFNSGSIIIHDSSYLNVGNVALMESYGNLPLPIFPSFHSGKTYLGEIQSSSIIEFTIDNNTLLSHSECFLHFTYHISGNARINFNVYDMYNLEYTVVDNNSDTSGEVVATIVPYLGVNFFEIELLIYGRDIWSDQYNITLTSSYLEIKEADKGFFGFGDLEIPFFQWPSYPIIGICILALWFMPYTILKYRAWKKLPFEIDVNILDNERGFDNIYSEGLSAGDDNDDFNESIDFNAED